MQLGIPDPSVRELGREEITTITINVTMPDSSSQSITLDQGQTVEYVRAYLHEHFGVPFVGSELRFEGKPMFDPMSLVDFGVKSGSTLLCKVEGAAAGGEM